MKLLYLEATALIPSTVQGQSALRKHPLVLDIEALHILAYWQEPMLGTAYWRVQFSEHFSTFLDLSNLRALMNATGLMDQHVFNAPKDPPFPTRSTH